jgi:AraC-like DNA-binding protein
MVVYKKYFFRVLFFVLILNFSFSYGQSEIDTLQKKSFDELFDLYNNSSNSSKRKELIDSYVNKAKKENNIEKLMTGYQIYTILHSDKRVLIYSDSIIKLSKPLNSHFNTSSAYQVKGEFYYNIKNFIKALNYFILAKEYAIKADNKYSMFYVNLSIGIIKDLIGEHSEALKIHKKNYKLAKKHIKYKDNDSYLQSIYAIAFSFNHMKETDSAFYYNKFGTEESIKLNNNTTSNYFVLNQGITHYHKKEYRSTIDSVQKVVKFLKEINDDSNLSEAYFYLGKSYDQEKNKQKALLYFKKVDTIFEKEKYLLPEIRESYEYIIKHYKNTNNLTNQLIYINKLIKLDSVLHLNELYLNKKIIKEYDIPILISEKEKIINVLKNKTSAFNIAFWVISAFVLLLIISLIIQYKKKKLYKKRFEDIIHTTATATATTTTTTTTNSIELPKETIDDVLDKLNSFEKKNKYLNHGISLYSLSKEFETNSKYLSKIINHYKNQSFPNYINTLRIEYIIHKIKTDLTIRKFTIKAISEEGGFSNSESFSKAFYKVKGVKPSYFLRELEKINRNN